MNLFSPRTHTKRLLWIFSWFVSLLLIIQFGRADAQVVMPTVIRGGALDRAGGVVVVDSSGNEAGTATNPQTVKTQLSWDNTGFASRGIVMDDCQFNNGSCGWVPLFTPSNSSGTEWGTVAVVNRATPALSVRSPDVALTSALNIAGIKRINVLGPGNYLAEFKISQENRTLSTDRPAQFVYAVDTADIAGNRCFFSIIDMIYNQSTSTQVNQIYLGVAGGNYLVGSYTAATNENKQLPVDFSLAFIIANGSTSTCKYAGLQISSGNSIYYKLGVFNSPSDTTLTSLNGPATTGTLTSFAGGFNPLLQIVNRSDASQTSGVVELVRQRSVYLGPTDWLGTGIKPNSTPIWNNNDSRALPINHPLDRWTLSTGANINSPEVEVRPGEKACFDLTVEAVAGSPTTSSLTATFQVSATQYLGNNWDSYTSGNPPVWQSVAAADGLLGGNISPSDWTAITQATTTRTVEERCFTAGPNAALVRMNVALTSTGGSSVSQQVSVSEAVAKTQY